MGRRLLEISRLPHDQPLALRQGGTFFHDLDESTHSDGMDSVRAKRVMVLREVLYTRALQRAAQRPSLDSLDDFQRDFQEIQTQFVRLVRTHFPARNPTEPYDGENMFAAVRAFVFAELPRIEIHGTPDSSYYFCFTELFGAFVQLANRHSIASQQSYWLPALKAFVMHGFAFSELYARVNSRKKEAYVGAQVRNMTHHMEPTGVLVAKEHAKFREEFGDAPVDVQWRALLALSARNVAEALKNDLDEV